MKNINKIRAAVVLATVIMAVVFVACNKEKNNTSDNIESVSNYENVGKMHNLCCQEVMTREDCDKDGTEKISTATIMNWIDICASILEGDQNVSTEELYYQVNQAKNFFSDYGDNSLGENVLFSELRYSENDIRRLLQQSGCPSELEDNIIELYNSCFEESKDGVDYLDSIRSLPNSTHRDVFLDVYENSSVFWEAYFEDESKAFYNDGSKRLPFGMDITEWMIVMDAMGSTAGIWGGPIGASIIGAAFSIAAKREYERDL